MDPEKPAAVALLTDTAQDIYVQETKWTIYSALVIFSHNTKFVRKYRKS